MHMISPAQAFKVRASRYQAAMQRAGSSRVRELLPLSTLLPSNKTSFLDLFCGTGFVSDFLNDKFDSLTLLDQVDELLPPVTTKRMVIHGNALDNEVLIPLTSKFDVAACVGGFHHILPVDETDFKYDQTYDYRKVVLSKWRQLLCPKGRLILADVPAIGELPLHEYRDLCQEHLPFGFSQDTMRRLENSFLVEVTLNPEPACFFDDYVANNCLVGHKAVYESKESLTKLMSDAGFQNVQSCVLSTPWTFRSTAEAAWFFHELFSIGSTSITTPDQVPEATIDDILMVIRNYLGISQLPDGGCLVGWKLLYVWGDQN